MREQESSAATSTSAAFSPVLRFGRDLDTHHRGTHLSRSSDDDLRVGVEGGGLGLNLGIWKLEHVDKDGDENWTVKRGLHLLTKGVRHLLAATALSAVRYLVTQFGSKSKY